MAEVPDAAPGRLVSRLRWLGRGLAVLSLLFGAAFVVLARRTAGAADGIPSALFWLAAVLQFGLVIVLLSRGRRA